MYTPPPRTFLQDFRISNHILTREYLTSIAQLGIHFFFFTNITGDTKWIPVPSNFVESLMHFLPSNFIIRWAMISNTP